MKENSNLFGDKNGLFNTFEVVIATCVRQSATGVFNQQSDWTFSCGEIDFLQKMRHCPVKMACCGVIFTAGSPRTPNSGFLVVQAINPPYDYIPNPVRNQYHHCKLFATGDDFDEDGVEQN